MNGITWALLSAVFAAVTALLAKLDSAQVRPNVATADLAIAVRTSIVALSA